MAYPYRKQIKPPLGTPLNKGHRLSKGLVGLWLFNDNPPLLGKTYDLSGNKNTGTLVGDTHIVPGKFGPCLSFDGAGDYVWKSVTDWRSTDPAGTIVGWIYLSALGAFQSIFSSADEASGDYYLWFNINNLNRLEIRERLLTSYIIYGDSVLESGKWYQVAVVSNGAAYSLYVNGILQNLTVVTSNTGRWFAGIANRDNFAFGVLKRSTLGYYFNGKIDDVMIFNHALSAAEIAQLYREPFAMFNKARLWGGAAVAGTNIKTINGLVYASIKTFNGLAMASVKTWNGLA